MRLRDAMDRADRLRPNAVHQYDKRLSLWRLEAQLAEMMGVDAPEWDEESDYDLLIPDPYSEIYPAHLTAYIDWAQEEMDLYQIDMITANQTTNEVKAWWRRTNRQPDDVRFKGVWV